MAFAITRCVVTGEFNTDTVKNRGFQRAELYCTAAATDVAYDLSNSGGTFWTATKSTAPGANSLAAIANIVAIGGKLIKVTGDFSQSYLRASATGTGAYTQSVTGNIPDIAFNASNGPTSIVIVLEWALPVSVMPITAEYSI